MDAARLVLDYIEVLRWPVFVGVFLLIFKTQAVKLVSRLTKLDAAGLSATFEQAAEEAEEVAESSESKPATEATWKKVAEGVRLTPTNYGQARRVGETFRNGRPVVMDLNLLSENDAKRLIDFAAGLVFDARGSITRVERKVFALIPPKDRWTPGN